MSSLRWVVAACAVVVALQSGSVRALPLFGRASGVACATCHVAGSRLTSAGMAFALRGDHFASAHHDSLIASAVVPVSLVAGVDASAPRHVARPSGSIATALRERWHGDRSAELHTLVRLGSLTTIRLAGGAGASDAGFESDLAYVRLDASPGPRGASLTAGEFDAELPFFSPRLRATRSANLAPLGADVTGFALGARAAGWAGEAGLVDGQRHPRGGRVEQAVRGLQDSYLWVTREQSGSVLGVRMLFDHQDSSLPSLRWMQHLKAEAGACVPLGRLTLIPGYVFDRFDDRPAAGIHERHQYALLEALAPLGARRRWLATARYEHEYRTRNAITREQDRQLAVADLAYEFVPGLRMALEWSLARDNVGDPAARALDAFVRMSY